MCYLVDIVSQILLGSAIYQYLNTISRADYFAAFWSVISSKRRLFCKNENEIFDDDVNIYHFLAQNQNF